MNRTNSASAGVIALAVTIGYAPIRMPQTSHDATPAVKIAYMPIEMPCVARVRQVCQACGTKAIVVSAAAR